MNCWLWQISELRTPGVSLRPSVNHLPMQETPILVQEDSRGGRSNQAWVPQLLSLPCFSAQETKNCWTHAPQSPCPRQVEAFTLNDAVAAQLSSPRLLQRKKPSSSKQNKTEAPGGPVSAGSLHVSVSELCRSVWCVWKLQEIPVSDLFRPHDYRVHGLHRPEYWSR